MYKLRLALVSCNTLLFEPLTVRNVKLAPLIHFQGYI